MGKISFKTNQGIKTMTNEEAQKMAGVNPDHSTEDLFNAIKNKEYPSWDVFVQIMTPEEAKTYKFDPFDVTKVWYHSRLSAYTFRQAYIKPKSR